MVRTEDVECGFVQIREVRGIEKDGDNKAKASWAAEFPTGFRESYLMASPLHSVCSIILRWNVGNPHHSVVLS